MQNSTIIQDNFWRGFFLNIALIVIMISNKFLLKLKLYTLIKKKNHEKVIDIFKYKDDKPSVIIGLSKKKSIKYILLHITIACIYFFLLEGSNYQGSSNVMSSVCTLQQVFKLARIFHSYIVTSQLVWKMAGLVRLSSVLVKQTSCKSLVRLFSNSCFAYYISDYNQRNPLLL